MANRSDMIISNKKTERIRMIELAIRAGTNVTKKETQKTLLYNTRYYLEHSMYYYIRNNWSHRKSNKRVREEFWKPYHVNFQ
jgi:hypothetical protein